MHHVLAGAAIQLICKGCDADERALIGSSGSLSLKGQEKEFFCPASSMLKELILHSSSDCASRDLLVLGKGVQIR